MLEALWLSWFVHAGCPMPFIRNLAVGILCSWMVLDAAIVFRRKTGAAENRDRYSMKFIMLASPLMMLIALLAAFGEFGTFGAMHTAAPQIAGLCGMTAGIGVRGAAIAQLGRFHTPNVAIRPDHMLREHGLYGLVRHPSYLGALAAFAGFGLALGNWLAFFVIAIAAPCIYLVRIREEEAALGGAFGESYAAYCRRTKRLIPWVY